MKKVFMRRGEVMAWLVGAGFSANQVLKLFKTGVICALHLPGNEKGRALYSRAQVVRDVLVPMGIAE
jgi:hypothetical protein